MVKVVKPFLALFLAIVFAYYAAESAAKPKIDLDKLPDCPACEGSGYEVCGCDKGKREWPCKVCTGNGKIWCPICKGYGVTPCSRCGDHQVIVSDEITPCKVCEGKFRIPCKACGGEGLFECKKCKGEGSKKSKCVICEGKRRTKCIACRGKKKDITGHADACPSCLGTASAACPGCNSLEWVIQYCSFCEAGTAPLCGLCEGTTRVICWHCKGDSAAKDRTEWLSSPEWTGVWAAYVADWLELTCGFCMSEGWLPCPACAKGIKLKCAVCMGNAREMADCPSGCKDGFYRCPYCEGTGEPQLDAAEGICPLCKGKKEVNELLLKFNRLMCPTCEGTIQTACTNCRGEKEIECPFCKGERKYNTAGKVARGPRICFVCAGKGKVGCPQCVSQGSFPCPDCERWGLTCNRIDPRKFDRKTGDRVKCPYCGGSGEDPNPAAFPEMFKKPYWLKEWEENYSNKPISVISVKVQILANKINRKARIDLVNETFKGTYVLYIGKILGYRKARAVQKENAWRLFIRTRDGYVGIYNYLAEEDAVKMLMEKDSVRFVGVLPGGSSVASSRVFATVQILDIQ